MRNYYNGQEEAVRKMLTNNASDILNTLMSMDKNDTLHGCFADIPNEVYHDPRCPGVSSTQIKGILKNSYRHYENDRKNQSNSMKFGSLFHAFVNEPEMFANSYQVIHKGKDAFLRPGFTAIKDSDFQLIQIMSKKLFEHPDASSLLKDSQYELSYFSRDQETGILKKCRVDAIKNDIVTDLKTCQDASPEAFARDCKKYLYRVSAAYYLEVVSEVSKKYLNKFYLIACETPEPNEISVYKVDERSIATGEEEVRKALRLIQKIKEQGEKAWTGYELGIKDLSI